MHETQKALLKAIRKNPNSSIRELQEACGIKNISVADYHLNKMMAAGLIYKVNKWVINGEH